MFLKLKSYIDALCSDDYLALCQQHNLQNIARFAELLQAIVKASSVICAVAVFLMLPAYGILKIFYGSVSV